MREGGNEEKKVEDAQNQRDWLRDLEMRVGGNGMTVVVESIASQAPRLPAPSLGLGGLDCRFCSRQVIQWIGSQ